MTNGQRDKKNNKKNIEHSKPKSEKRDRQIKRKKKTDVGNEKKSENRCGGKNCQTEKDRRTKWQTDIKQNRVKQTNRRKTDKDGQKTS